MCVSVSSQFSCLDHYRIHFSFANHSSKILCVCSNEKSLFPNEKKKRKNIFHLLVLCVVAGIILVE